MANTKKKGNNNSSKMTEKDRHKIAKGHKVVTEEVNVMQATEVRANFQDIIDRVHYTKDALIISKHKKPWVIISPLAEED